jgi:hypothetical protein
VRVVRAWPAETELPDRPHVIDGWPRIPVTRRDGCSDYGPGLLAAADDLIVLDWDVAVDLDDLRRFASHVRGLSTPVVGPNRLFDDPAQTVWAFKRYLPGERSMRWCDESDGTCHLFGFGFVYLPRVLVVAWTAANPGEPLDDMTFSGWHYRKVAEEVAIDWSVRAAHVHYEPPAGGVM